MRRLSLNRMLNLRTAVEVVHAREGTRGEERGQAKAALMAEAEVPRRMACIVHLRTAVGLLGVH